MMLDAGAAGIIAPYIETCKQVEDLIGAVKKRPLQGKILADSIAAGAIADDKLAAYIEEKNAGNALILNIESAAGVENLPKLLNYPEVDGVLIGPHDLSCSLGIPEEYENPIFLDAVEKIIRTARVANKGAGYHKGYPGPMNDLWSKLFSFGANLIIHEADVISFIETLRRDIAHLRGEKVDNGEEYQARTY